MSLLAHPVIHPQLNKSHHQLYARANEFFTDSNIRSWLEPEHGFIKKSIWQEFAKLGFIGLSISEEYGGQAPLSNSNQAYCKELNSLVLREAMQNLSDNGLCLGFHVHNDVALQWLSVCPNIELKKTYLPKAAKGELIFCTCYTERDKNFTSHAIEDGNDLIINARKGFAVNGYHADCCMVTLNIGDSVQMVLVEKDRAGVEVTKLHQRLGNRSIDQADITFTEVRVPKTNIITANFAQRVFIWNHVMTYARFHVALDAYYLHQRVLQRLSQYILDKPVGGRALHTWPLQRESIARGQADLHLMRAGLINVFTQLDSRKLPVNLAAKVKYFSVAALERLARQACEMEGGMGYMYDGHFLNDYLQCLGLKFSTGSQTVMTEIADNAHQSKIKVAQLMENS